MYALLPSAPEPGSGHSPDKRRKKRWALAALALAGLAFATTVSQWATVKIFSNPPGVLDSTSYVPTGTVVPVSTPPMSANGSRFTHWTVNGVRQVDGLGISMSALSLTITGSIDVVAQYTPETQDLDSDQVPDWYELLQYGNTLTGANDDTDNDGVTLYDEYVKGTQPRIHDSAAGGGIVEGGISRRRSGTVPIRNAANPYFLSYTESSTPPGAIARQEWVPPGTSLTTTAPSLEQWGYKFGQWKLNGVRQESSSGVSLTQATFTITQDSSAVAEYVSTTQDSDGDSIPDWYEIQQYGNLLTGSGDDTDGDAVGFYDEYVAGTQPRIPDYASGGGILEGGIARRRSGTIQITTSPTYYTYTERSDPPGVVSVQSSHPAGTSITTSNQNGEVWGYRFTHWTINGVRQQAGAGFAVSQATFNLAGNTVAQANFIATTQDLDSDQIPDWYEIQQYGAISNGPDSDTDGDGVVFYDEYIKGTQPLIHDSAAAGGIVEGGTSRRRGASTVVDLSLLLEDFSLATNTTQESNIPVKVGELTSTSTAIGIVVTANSGFEVRLVGGKYEVWTTLPTDYETTPILSIVLAVTNSRGTTINVSGTAGLTDNRFEDADGDGLTEAQEEDTYGTSDIVADFDADNYRDGVEVAAGTGPADPHSFPWDGDIPLPQTWVKVAGGNAKDMGFRGDRFVSVEQSSVDGSTWATNNYGTNSALFGFAGYGDGLWWGSGTNGLLRAGTNTDTVLLSWQSRTNPETNDLAQLAYGERTYLARGPLNSGGVIRSINGTSWSQVGTAVGASNARSLVFAGSRFLMAAGSEIRSMPSGSSGTWITNLVTNRPAGFLLTNLLARNGSVFAGSSLAADTNGRRSMVIGQSTNGTNWSFQTSSLTISSGVELAEVAQGFYFATPTVTNGNAWFLVSSNASNWLKVTGSWTNGRVARGIAAGAGQLMVATDDGLYAGRFNRTGKDFTTTHENFNAALGTNWTIRKPFSDSDVQVTGGNLRLLNRGTVILEKEFDGAFEASGRIRFAGSAYDSLRIVYASDKTSTSGSREMDKGLAISLSSRGGDWAPFGPKISLAVANYPDNGTVLGSADPTVAMNTWTDFRIVDDGKTIRMYWDDLVNPVITSNYSGSRRGYFAIYNREGSGGGSSISAGSVVEVERLTIRGAELAKLAQTISFPLLSQKTYGDLPFSVGATATSGLPLTYASDNTGVAIVATNGMATIMGVGTSRITASQAGNTNYHPATTVERSLTVVARPITIRANDVTRGYGETNPALTSQVSAGSLVSGHTYTANLATTATSGSLGANSPYPITVSNVVVRDAGGSDVTANYQVTTTNGNLYVPSLPQTISFPVIAAKTYGDPSFLLGATASSGLSVTYTVADPNVALVATNGAVTILRSGSTTITASQAGSSLYDPAASITRTLAVSARPLTLRADDKSRMFGQANPALTYSAVSGSLISGHVASISLSTTATINSVSSVTPYPISLDSVVIWDSLAQDVSVHYLMTLLNGGLTVTGTTPQITSTSSFSGTVGVAFSNTVTASGTAPITFFGSNLPTGLNIATNGLISGTPSGAGTNNATLRASNSIGSTNQNVTFTIAKGTPVISNWPSASPITYGQALSNSVLSVGSANVPGSFAWVNPTNRPNVGTNSQSVSFTPTATSNYNSVTSNINVVVNPAAAVLTWMPSPAASLTHPAPLSSAQLNATSTVAGGFDYLPTNGAVLNAGTNTLVATFRPTDTNSYFDGVTITNTVVVAKGSSTIIFGSLPTRQLGEDSFELTATASSGLPVSFTSADTNVAMVSGNTVTIVGAGTTEIVASQGGDGNWNSASEVTNSLTVLARTPLTITGASVTGRAYDGTRSANVDFSLAELEGVAAGDDVQLVSNSAAAEYADTIVGVGKSVSVTGLSLSGVDAGRYELGSVLLLSGNISPAVLTIENLTVTEKRYDGTTVAPLVWGNHSLSGYVNGEGTNEARLAQLPGSGSYGNALVGTSKPVTLAGLSLTGSGKDNYTVSAPSNLTGTILKGWVEIGISNTNQVYGKTNRVVTTALNLSVAGLGVRTNYWGTNGTVYGPSSNGPVRAGQYGVEVVVEDNSQTYEGTNRAVLTVAPLGVVVAAYNDTIFQGGVFDESRCQVVSSPGLFAGDTLGGSLTTHLRSVVLASDLSNLTPYVGMSSAPGMYRVLRGTVGVNSDYRIDSFQEGMLMVLGDSVVTKGTVVPLGMGQGFTAVVLSNRAVTNWGVTGLPPVPSVINVSNVMQAGFVGSSGLGAGGGANFALTWMTNGNGVVWGNTNALNGSTNLWVTNSPRGVAAMVGLAPTGTNPWVVAVRDDGLQEVVMGTIPGGRITNARVVALASGTQHGLSLCADGRVMGWGQDPFTYGMMNVPETLSNAVAVAAGTSHSVAIRKDGTVVTWGKLFKDNTAVPLELSSTSAPTFVRAVAVVAAAEHNLVLRADGSLRWWGPTNDILNPGHSSNAGLDLGNTSNPVVAMGVSATPHAAAVRRNGQVVVWGNTTASITNVGTNIRALVPMGGADSDRDGWANEAELRVGTDPLSTNSFPVKVSFKINFRYDTNRTTYEQERELMEGSNRVVGRLEILDTMGRLENGSQSNNVTLGEGNQELFMLEQEGTNRTLKFKADPVHSSRSPNADVYQVNIIVKDGDGGGEVSSPLVVKVANRKPTLSVPANLQVPEESPVNTPVGTPLGADERIIDWKIVPGDGIDYFKIDSATGQISVKAPADYENLPADQKSISFTVQATDSALATMQTIVSVAVTDIIEDTVAPVLALNGVSPMRVGQNDVLSDPGARVSDNVDAQRTVYAPSGTVNTGTLGLYLLTYTASDAAGNAASPLTRQVIVDGWTGVLSQPGWPLTTDALNRYAIGGASSLTSATVPMSVSRMTDTNGQPILTLSVLVRINDPYLQVQAQAVSNLVDFANPTQITTVGGTVANDQSNVPVGFQRQTFTVPATTDRRFLRLQISR